MTARSFLYGSVVLKNKSVHRSSSSPTPADPFSISRSSSFQGSPSMLSFEDKGGKFWDHQDNGDDEYLHQPEKIRRLTTDQVDELGEKMMLQQKGTLDSSGTKSLSQPQLCQHVPEGDVSKNMNMGNGQNGDFVEKILEFDNRVHTSLIVRVDSSYVFEKEKSDGSLDEENNLSKMFLPSVDGYTSPKM
ncbi:hypothetical protein L1987_53056 [Smallanthus sonchifolius]|uniref:Uncharacterized protein n=1 Tax=Smallanthus sonchifolius TaxID=185202 RepID=A0ACB9EUU1_9ASTR|nr:hypothetical protein L1987_53056 [Smallanthus sonchifolius]